MAVARATLEIDRGTINLWVEDEQTRAYLSALWKILEGDNEETDRVSLQPGRLNHPRETRDHSEYDGIGLVLSGWAITRAAALAAALGREDRT